MKNILRYGPTRRMVKVMIALSWPIIRYGKSWSNKPFLKHIINPFFMRPYNELSSVPVTVPVNAELRPPESVPVPLRVLERLVTDIEDRFILNECICRGHDRCVNHPRDLGCLALGPAIDRMHPSHGRRASAGEAVAHVRRAVKEGLVPNLAHVWIDPLAFGLTKFQKLMFICFCDDCCCLYRKYMTDRGPNLDRAYKRLPGISMRVDASLCDGCGDCAGSCFLGVIRMENGIAVTGGACAGCGKCVGACAKGARALVIPGEEELYRTVIARVREMSDVEVKAGRS